LGALQLEDTHGILRREGCRRQADSQGLAWSGLFAAVQTERPYEDSFPAVASHLVILHLDGLVAVDRWVAGAHERHSVPPGGTFVMPGGVDFRVRLGGTLSTVHLYLQDRIFAEVAGDLAWRSAGGTLAPRLGARDPLLESLILGIRDEMIDPGLLGDGYVDYLARAVAARLIRTSLRAPPPSPRREAVAKGAGRVARAVDYLDANLHRAVSLDEIAALLGLSVSQTIQLFKATVGMPPHRFILSRRVARARDLLRRRDLPLVEVALACGFAHQEHMSRVFKREMKTSPGAYRTALG
jgi:AraC family transcriptional regulator